MLENRKQKEKDLHNKLRDEALKNDGGRYRYFTSNKKFYSITRSNVSFVREWLLRNAAGKMALDYCCGDGGTSIFLAKNGIDVVGIDISDTSIENCKRSAAENNVSGKAEFLVRDAENTGFADNTFDVVFCLGVLHHLDTNKAFKEISRILKPDGMAICNEPLIYNPVFQLYRKMTPHLRSVWETDHILGKKDIAAAKKNFGRAEMRFFHLFTVLAVPFRETPLFNPLLKLFEIIDGAVLRIPGIKWLSWQTVFILSLPKK